MKSKIEPVTTLKGSHIVPTVLIIDAVHPVLVEVLQKNGLVCDYKPDITPSEVISIISNYDGLVIRGKIKLDKNLIDQAVNLKFIARAGAGMENIDHEYAESKGVTCINAPEGNRDAVAEHALGMLLMLFRNLKKGDAEVRKGIWDRISNTGIELNGRTVGILGYGNMGSAFAQRLIGFGVEVIAYDKYKRSFSDQFVKEVSLPEFFERTEVLGVHVPLTPETHHMVDASFLGSFKNSIYLINTARGKIVKTEDLVQLIRQEKVLGACLDVLEYENFTFNDLNSDELPPAFQELIKSDRVILTPHVAGVTNESFEKIAKTLSEKIAARFESLTS